MSHRTLCTLIAVGVVTPALAAPKPAPKTAAPAKKPAASAARTPAFTPAVLDLAPGETYVSELLVPSPTGKRYKGAFTVWTGEGLTLKQDGRWKGEVPAWGLKLFPKITAAADAHGDQAVEIRLSAGARARLNVRVREPQLELTPGDRKLTVKVTNPFGARLMTGRVQASNPDRFLQDVTSLEFKLAPGATGELVFPLPGAAPAEGETYDFTIRVQTYQGYNRETLHKLAFPPQDPK